MIFAPKGLACVRERFGKPACAFAPAMSEGARARMAPRAVRSPARGGELSFALFAMVIMEERAPSGSHP